MSFVQKLGKHKFLIAIVVVVIGVAGYFGYQKLTVQEAPIRYTMTTVTKGTLIESVSGSGQVSVSNQIDVKPKASGDITYLPITEGSSVKSGAVIARIDATDAYKSVRDAQSNLESAKLALEKLQQPVDALSLTQAQNALDQANQSKIDAQASLKKSYDDGLNEVSNTFLDLPTVMTGLNTVLYSNTLDAGQANIDYFANTVKAYDETIFKYQSAADTAYKTARALYDQNFTDYKATSRYADTAAIEALINETYNTTKSISEAIKNAINLLGFYEDLLAKRKLNVPATVSTYDANLISYTGKTNSHVTNLLNVQNTISSSKDNIVNADQTIKEREQSLEKLQAGTDPLDIASQQLSIKQRQNALTDAQAALTDYTVRAPFDGVVAAVNVKVGDPVSSGTAIATIITQQKIAEVSLNEVDAAKVKAGQKATLTFDAIDGLSISGEVSLIDTLGTVSSGVVNYDTIISLDTQDTRVKPGMSVTAVSITDAKPHVLLLPNAAVK
ncbi:MAG: HlyD family efflux transporter periplasmic adaptor subunit, partial [Patescibacteria group bacterium]|nr:HlyD family efflux transporter periplasmic adaptor subunit [Patescibacteria group bacterium]